MQADLKEGMFSHHRNCVTHAINLPANKKHRILVVLCLTEVKRIQYQSMPVLCLLTETEYCSISINSLLFDSWHCNN